jgi:3-hydroxybutyryl-CoA dehydrogenase
MDAKPFQRLCVVGAGFMGSQIALHAAAYGYEVWLVDISQAILDHARCRQAEELEVRGVEGGLDAGTKAAIAGRIHARTDLGVGAQEADLAIEAVPESLELKRDLFARLDQLCPQHAILASTSSALPCSAFAGATGRPESVLNLHFHPPVWRRPLVEVMGGSKTAAATISTSVAFARSVGLTPIMVRRENVGFVLNCVWRAVKCQSLELVDRGVASHEDVDRAWMIATGMEIGPFGLMDMVGLDVVRDIETIYRQNVTAQPEMPPKVLLDLIAAGRLGVKTAHGFYEYPQPAFRQPGWLKGEP